ncbi:MAG: hypothetical protein NZ455_07775 [Bacteroidia bacterium]|nr:hypothetical protein [Bacteroidia bacterium]MDW8347691.1 hypothetical protein [Bacteroidia bacterium]
MRSEAQHRSDSAARSTPTRAQRGTRPKNKADFENHYHLTDKIHPQKISKY